MKKLLAILAALAALLGGCVEQPEGIKPVEDFDAQRYLGKWYEIARLDHSFERGLEQITATYSLRDDGGIRVINRGYSLSEQKFTQAEGKAYFVQGKEKGFLKVSFFGPFYGSYIVIDTDYESYTMISGPDRSYFWILSRTPKMDRQLLDRLVARAKTLGFETDSLIYVRQ